MAITTADIKFLASARMTNAADGGGQMTSTVVVDGVDNNVFTDLTTVARAQGAMQARKVFGAVLSTGSDAFLDAHLVLDDTSDDVDVNEVLLPAASITEELAGLVSRMNDKPAALGCKGLATLTTGLASGALGVAVDATRVAIIPSARSSAAATGSLAAGGGERVTGYLLSDADLDLSALGGYQNSASLVADPTGLAAGHYKVRVKASLPLQTVSLTVTAANQSSVYFIAIPLGTEVGSESVRLVRSSGFGSYSVFTLRSRVGGGGDTTVLGNAPVGGSVGDALVSTGYLDPGTTATVDRAAGQVSLTLGVVPSIGDVVTVGFAAGGNSALVPFAGLSNAGVVTSNTVTVTTTSGRRASTATFRAGGANYQMRNGVVARVTDGVTIGAFNEASGVLSLPSLNGLTLSEWRATEVSTSVGVSTLSATISTALSMATVAVSGTTVAGAAFTSTASAEGVFSSNGVSGSYNDLTGALALTFAAPVRSDTLAWAATQYTYTAGTSLLPGLAGGLFAASGKVPIFAKDDLVVLQHFADTAPATVANGAVIDCARTLLASARVVGNDGKAVAGGYTANLAAGTVTVTSIAGWAQPVRVRHAIDHTAVVAAAPTSVGLVLNRAPTRAFAAGSVVSSALLLGDLQAVASAAFSQSSWTEVWQDSRIGAGIVAQYQDVSVPIEVDNRGSVAQRWAVIFTTSTAFRLVGETLGQIATGAINSDLLVVNPATGIPYFTLRATGWGLGWSAGNVLRFATRAANSPVWVLRTTQPSAPSSVADSLTLALRGDINI